MFSGGESMIESKSSGKNLVLVVIFSSIIFLILHSTELPFQEYGNIYLLTLLRVLIFAPLLFFLYKGYNSARITIAILFSILLLVGIFAIIFIDLKWLTVQNYIFISKLFFCQNLGSREERCWAQLF